MLPGEQGCVSAVLSKPLNVYLCFVLSFVSAVAFHPDGNCIGVGTTDNVVKVQSYSTKHVVMIMELIAGSMSS